MDNIQFIDLQAQRAYLGSKIDQAISGVLEHGRFIMGPEVKKLETGLAEFGGTERAMTCSSGTDALLFPLMAWGIGLSGAGRKDAVFVPSFTFASTAEMVALAGATPIFIDILPDTFNMDTAHLARTIEYVIAKGEYTPRAIIAVDLFGQIANYPEIKKLAEAHDIKLISDAAQGYGATLNGKQAGHWADAVTTSFFPAKPLGCYGDGGAVLTNDHTLADVMESLRVHGKGTDKYDNVRIGMNGRMDTIQAAITLEKLAIFAEEVEKRNKVAEKYNEQLKDFANVPTVMESAISTWAQYTLIVENRTEVQKKLSEVNVPTAVYYPKPLHLQTAYKDFPIGAGGLPVSEKMMDQVMSLPMHPYLDDETQNYIIEHVKKSVQHG